jgi:hypothetical protein
MGQTFRKGAIWRAIRQLADGPYCHATNRELAHAAGLRSRGTVTSCLVALEEDGFIRRYDWRDGISHRMFILVDHPEAATAMEWIYAPVAPPHRFRVVRA